MVEKKILAHTNQRKESHQIVIQKLKPKEDRTLKISKHALKMNPSQRRKRRNKKTRRRLKLQTASVRKMRTRLKEL